mmetsp:Transcript_83683/g.200767  ORF Transcript_83683/g.200767 Transcript_83683/m.200767 type:complete len:282 (+) Transcript_83683:47-892(+)|eukprot:CAMPEP_0181445424 /NCGR_PEP_ID=MMETSP1110-20121109/25579_1 /TAXON_ID=174948 /ORGANISM="Symbiodinium sp., Strain CCMP421" /LENGTH=281 /DNA_ID=CAMNT_0023569465 /DNA_START=46 /DNA_END=891 /DNA_ORIENTATION=+
MAYAAVFALLGLGYACDEDCHMSLLQTGQKLHTELTMTYVPFNFGHTVAEKAAQHGIKWGDCGSRAPIEGCIGWMKSEVTGCDLMYTPGKYWPQTLAETYFGNRTAFGILRDPYERLVAQFRGTYRLQHPEFQCDANAAVRSMMEEYLEALESGNPWYNNCNYLPQAEFFDQPHGAHIAIDNREFPESMNQIFRKTGNEHLEIATEEVAHVGGCDTQWAADLDSETRALVRKVYHRDFQLLCERFGYCDAEENTCLTRVPQMCPPQLYEWNTEAKMYEPKM